MIFRGILGWVLVLLFTLPLYAKNSGASVPITQPNSVEAVNVRLAAEFIRTMGNPEVADNILQMLTDGKIYSDDTMGKNGETGDMTDGDITLSHDLIRLPKTAGPTRSNSPFDSERDFSWIVELARTLFHEKIHVHQSGLFIAGSNLKIGSTPHEQEAWESTINVMNLWFQRLYDEYRQYPVDPREATDATLKHTRDAERLRLLSRGLQVLNVKNTYVNNYIGNDTLCHGSDNAAIFQELAVLLQRLKGRLEPTLNELELKQTPPSDQTNEDVGRLIDEEKSLGERCALGTPRLPKDSTLLTLVGQGRAAGHIFDLEVTNPSKAPISATLPVGLALVPSDGDYQTMMIGEPLQVAVGPGQSATIAVTGYCLDHGKLPPPKGLRVGIPQATVESAKTTIRHDANKAIVEITTTSNIGGLTSRIRTLDPRSGKVVALHDEVRVPGKLVTIERDPLSGKAGKIQLVDQPILAGPPHSPKPQNTPPPGLHWSPQASNQPGIELLGCIATAGNQLSKDKKLATDIQSADRYRATVVQRAIWSFVNGLNEDALLADTRQQMEALPAEKRPPDTEVVKTVGRIWDDVELTLKTARVAK